MNRCFWTNSRASIQCQILDGFKAGLGLWRPLFFLISQPRAPSLATKSWQRVKRKPVSVAAGCARDNHEMDRSCDIRHGIWWAFVAFHGKTMQMTCELSSGCSWFFSKKYLSRRGMISLSLEITFAGSTEITKFNCSLGFCLPFGNLKLKDQHSSREISLEMGDVDVGDVLPPYLNICSC